jgi:dUTP pyrophosphatase
MRKFFKDVIATYRRDRLIEQGAAHVNNVRQAKVQETDEYGEPINEEQTFIHVPPKPPEMVVIKVKRLTEDVKMPAYKHPGDSGADLAAAERVELGPKETRIVPTGLVMEIPYGYELQVRPRSGTSLKTPLRIANAPGTVDSNYRGEIGVIVTNTSIYPEVVEKGTRIAQAVIAPVVIGHFVDADEMEDTSRGAGGYGSTGEN